MMDMSQKISSKLKSLSKTKKSGLKVLIIFVLGILTFSFGVGIGDAFYSVFGN